MLIEVSRLLSKKDEPIHSSTKNLWEYSFPTSPPVLLLLLLSLNFPIWWYNMRASTWVWTSLTIRGQTSCYRSIGCKDLLVCSLLVFLVYYLLDYVHSCDQFANILYLLVNFKPFSPFELNLLMLLEGNVFLPSFICQLTVCVLSLFYKTILSSQINIF